ncbi:MAG: dihydrolipoamide acetyltransferase family protein [Sphaerochaetaceae bacterium]|jgi:pyruvate dehydrogenase E2 component (dihydrolipoamide acetyltransferase)
MATEVLMPKQGNTVESCTIIEWKVAVGDMISIGTIVCEAETDKSTIEVESTAEGSVLALLYQEGDDVPVMTPILAVGEKGESYTPPKKEGELEQPQATERQNDSSTDKNSNLVTHTQSPTAEVGASPRAKVAAKQLDINLSLLRGSGAKGLIVEKDVLAHSQSAPILTPVAKEKAQSGNYTIPQTGSGMGQRVLSGDLTLKQEQKESTTTSVTGIRKVIAQRMFESLSTTAQFTLNSFADARMLLSLRKRFKESDEHLNLRTITINDLILYVVSRSLKDFPALNAHYYGETIERFSSVHLGSAVDTPKGLLVPVIKSSESKSLKQISEEFKDLANQAIEGKSLPDDLTGSTFTVTNLGSLGIESFTPVLNIPEVAILGVGAIAPKAVQVENEIEFIPHIALSLTINHQAVDGAPAARFLQHLSHMIAQVDLLLAI